MALESLEKFSEGSRVCLIPPGSRVPGSRPAYGGWRLPEPPILGKPGVARRGWRLYACASMQPVFCHVFLERFDTASFGRLYDLRFRSALVSNYLQGLFLDILLMSEGRFSACFRLPILLV